MVRLGSHTRDSVLAQLAASLLCEVAPQSPLPGGCASLLAVCWWAGSSHIPGAVRGVKLRESKPQACPPSHPPLRPAFLSYSVTSPLTGNLIGNDLGM